MDASAASASAETGLEVPWVAVSIVGGAYCMAYCMSVAVDQGTLLATATTVDMAVAAFRNPADLALLEEASVHTSSYLATVAMSDGKDYNHPAVRAGVSIDSWSTLEFSLFRQSRASSSYRVVQPSFSLP